uniref:BPTI/Kunitz inhibitor domain-containing protein n=1 Tax=Panagrolaimus superbus TaxID=310955 RepID=A0A914Y8A7_9BILA
MDVGRCSGHFQAFYYEVATGSCQQFEYSGCGGNANRFHSKDQCENLCLRNHNVPIRIGLAGAGRVEQVPTHPGGLSQNGNGNNNGDQQSCEHPKDTGPCNRFVTKWYFNKGDGTCNRFHYGGCEGNSNRFENEQECRNKCGDYIDTCHLPKVSGPCAGKNERFFFNTATKICESFTFGGCLGNNNNFRTIEECEARCGGNRQFI